MPKYKITIFYSCKYRFPKKKKIRNNYFVLQILLLCFAMNISSILEAQSNNVQLSCVSNTQCDLLDLSANATYNLISIVAYPRSVTANSLPEIHMNGNKLTVDSIIITNDVTATSQTNYSYRIQSGTGGELIILDTFKYENISPLAAYPRPILELDKLTLYGNFTIINNRNAATAGNQYTHFQINTLEVHPGSSLNIINSSFTSNITPAANTSHPLTKLSIFGNGGNGISDNNNTVVYKSSYETITRPLAVPYILYTNAIEINLLDTGIFGNDTVLFKFDNSDLTDPSDISNSGLMYVNPPNYMSLSINVVDEFGQNSLLKNLQQEGATFTIVNKISSNVSSNTIYYPSQKAQFNKTYYLEGNSYVDLSLIVFLDESQGPDNLSLKGTWGPYNADKSIPLLEGIMANIIALQNSYDLLTESALSNAMKVSDARYNKNGIGLFSSFSASNQKIATGSHIDYSGFNFVGGPAANYDTPFGHLLVGGFIEVGSGNYTTTNKFTVRAPNGKPEYDYIVTGDGEVNYLGFGLIARHDFTPGYYGEISVKTGRVNNEFSSPDMGSGVKYSSESNYLGFHGGLGYRFEYMPGLWMDTYGKLFYTEIEGNRLVTFDGTNLNFDKSKFLRSRLGVRYTAQVKDSISINFGGAWDYNYGDDNNYGSYKGSVTSNSTPISPGKEPSINGSTGILELGVEYKPFENTGFSMALSGNAYLGHTEGASGSLNLKYVFGTPKDGSSSASSQNYNPPSSGDLTGTYSTLPFISSNSTADESPVLVAQSSPALTGGSSENSDDSDLEQVTVFSDPQWKKNLSPGTVSVVVPDDYQGEQKSVANLLEMVPGLHVSKRGGSGQYSTVNVRGSTSAQVSIYVDGVPQNLGGDPAADLSLYTSENVSRIEVYKGYIPVRFTGAPIGGVINIVTKKPSRQSTLLSVGTRSYGGFQANALFTSPLLDGSMLVSATRDQSRGNIKYKFWQAGHYYNPNSTSPYHSIVDRRRMNNSHQKTDVMVKWQTNHISVQGSWKEMDRYYPWTTQDTATNGIDEALIDIDTDPWGLNRRNRQLVIERNLVLGYRNQFSNLDWGIEVDLKKQSKDFRWEEATIPGQQGFYPSPGIVWSTYDTDRWGVTLDASYNLGDWNMLEFRGSFSYEELHMNGNDWLSEGVVSNYMVRMKSDYRQKVTNLQLQDTITIDDDLWLTFVYRANHVYADGIDGSRFMNQSGGNIILAPSNFSSDFATDGDRWNYTYGIAVKKTVNKSWTLKATGGTFVRYPNFYELFGDGVYVRPAFFTALGPGSIPVPRPEKGEQWDFTVEWNGEIPLPLIVSSGNFSASYFSRRTVNMIGLFQTPMYVYYGNYGTTKANGIEIEAGIKSKYADFSFSGTWLQTKVIDIKNTDGGDRPSNYYSEGHPVLNSPQFESHLRGDFRVPLIDSLTIFAEHHFIDRVPISTSNTVLLLEDKLHTVNLGFRVELPFSFQLTAGVNDVFNHTIKQGVLAERNRNLIPKGATSTLYFPKEGRIMYITAQKTF
jgi:outer membrane receptor for ferrienterochelin and colicin